MKLTKSKQFLADAIHASGKGWLDGADSAVQDKDMWICLYEGKPTRHGESWTDDGDCLYKLGFNHDKLLPNWHQTVLSRDEYFSAYPETVEPVADVDGWIEWNGVAKSPVGKGVAVDVKMKNGTHHFGQLIDDECWDDHWGDASIIAYRLHRPEVNPEFCESVARSIPEPDAKPTIEQLAADYRNKLDYANRKQKEADAAKEAANAALAELVAAGKALGLLLSVECEGGVATPEHPPLIAGWRQWEVGDFVSWSIVGHVGEFRIIAVHHDPSRNIGDFEVEDKQGDVYRVYGNECRFIRRP